MAEFFSRVGLILHGILQYILYLAPLVEPLQESLYPPSWWYDYFGFYDWFDNLDSQQRPNDEWIRMFISASWRRVSDLVLSEAQEAIDTARAFLRDLIGTLPWLFNSVSQWVNWLSNLLGVSLPWWAQNALDGLRRLYDWLPDEITKSGLTWSAVWDWLVQTAIDWVANWAGDAINYALHLWAWLQSVGNAISEWWTSFRDILADFAQDPLGFVRRLLGEVWNWIVDVYQRSVEWVKQQLDPYWTPLENFARDCLVYWYNLWAYYSELLNEFLADPIDFLANRLEEVLERYW